MTDVTTDTPKPRPKSLLLTRVTPGIALIVIAAIAALRLWVVETAIVAGDSMRNTLQDGDHVLISKLLQVSRFDIVVLNDPEVGGVDIKRVVAAPGDTISMVPYTVQTGGGTAVYGSQLYLNSIPYTEPYATSVIPRSLPPAKIAKDAYFVLGDNRDDSTDSRRYGALNAKRVRGVALAVVYPLNRFRILDRDPRAAPDTNAIVHR